MLARNKNRAYSILEERFGASLKLAGAGRILYWDSQAYMPPDGAWARGEQLTAITGAIHELTTRADTADLFAEAQGDGQSLTDMEQANLAAMRSAWLHTVAVPKDLALEKQRLATATQAVWRSAKAENDFDAFADAFSQLAPVIREVAQVKAEAFDLEPYAALLEEYDPGLAASTIESALEEMETELPQLLAQVIERQKRWPQPIPFDGIFRRSGSAISPISCSGPS